MARGALPGGCDGGFGGVGRGQVGVDGKDRVDVVHGASVVVPVWYVHLDYLSVHGLVLAQSAGDLGASQGVWSEAGAHRFSSPGAMCLRLRCPRARPRALDYRRVHHVW